MFKLDLCSCCFPFFSQNTIFFQIALPCKRTQKGPAKAGTGKRTLRGSWLQTAQSAASSDRNIQFHAIAVDAGGPIGGGGVETRCAHGRGVGSVSVILQAATLN